MRSLLTQKMPVAVLIAILFSCSKYNGNLVDIGDLEKEIPGETSGTVIIPSYQETSTNTSALSTAINAFITTTNDSTLAAARQAWKSVHSSWAKTESFLFGPATTDSIGKQLHSWPVDITALDIELSNSNPFTEVYIDSLAGNVKGFHAIEYLLWGLDSTKTAATFTQREKEYITALSQNLSKLCNVITDNWVSSYGNVFASAGSTGNTIYPTLQSVYMEMANAMDSVCNNLANKKMQIPLTTQDSSMEENAFAKNSIADFINNLQSVINLYECNFNSSGKSMQDLVDYYNLALDDEITQKHTAAISALKQITAPFGTAIKTQRSNVQNAIDKINELQTVLEVKLKPFVQQNVH